MALFGQDKVRLQLLQDVLPSQALGRRKGENGDDLTGEARLSLTLNACVRLFGAASAQLGGVVLYVDCIHTMDANSLQLLKKVWVQFPLWFVLTAIGSENHLWNNKDAQSFRKVLLQEDSACGGSQGEGAATTTLITLPPLSDEETDHFIAVYFRVMVSDQEPHVWAKIRAAIATSDGNPLLLHMFCGMAERRREIFVKTVDYIVENANNPISHSLSDSVITKERQDSRVGQGLAHAAQHALLTLLRQRRIEINDETLNAAAIDADSYMRKVFEARIDALSLQAVKAINIASASGAKATSTHSLLLVESLCKMVWKERQGANKMQVCKDIVEELIKERLWTLSKDDDEQFSWTTWRVVEIIYDSIGAELRKSLHEKILYLSEADLGINFAKCAVDLLSSQPPSHLSHLCTRAAQLAHHATSADNHCRAAVYRVVAAIQSHKACLLPTTVPSCEAALKSLSLVVPKDNETGGGGGSTSKATILKVTRVKANQLLGEH